MRTESLPNRPTAEVAAAITRHNKTPPDGGPERLWRLKQRLKWAMESVSRNSNGVERMNRMDRAWHQWADRALLA